MSSKKGNVKAEAAPQKSPAELLAELLKSAGPEGLAAAIRAMGNDALNAVAAESGKAAAERKAAEDKAKREAIDAKFSAELAAADEACNVANKARQAVIDRRAEEYRAAGLSIGTVATNGNGTHKARTPRTESTKAKVGQCLREKPHSVSELFKRGLEEGWWAAELNAITDEVELNARKAKKASSIKWYCETSADEGRGYGLTADADGRYSLVGTAAPAA